MIYLKRFMAFALVGALLISFTSCKEKVDFVFDSKGIYQVTEVNTDISFTANMGEMQNRALFTSPSSIEGLTAVQTNGKGYDLKYKDMSVSLGSFAVKTADDFFAAMETLEQAGVYADERITATVDGIQVKGIIENGRLTRLYFTDGLNDRKYKITTEATVWKTVQKQG